MMNCISLDVFELILVKAYLMICMVITPAVSQQFSPQQVEESIDATDETQTFVTHYSKSTFRLLLHVTALVI